MAITIPIPKITAIYGPSCNKNGGRLWYEAAAEEDLGLLSHGGYSVKEIKNDSNSMDCDCWFTVFAWDGQIFRVNGVTLETVVFEKIEIEERNNDEPI